MKYLIITYKCRFVFYVLYHDNYMACCLASLYWNPTYITERRLRYSSEYHEDTDYSEAIWYCRTESTFAWRHQAATGNNVDLQSLRKRDNNMRVIRQEDNKITCRIFHSYQRGVIQDLYQQGIISTTT